MNNETHINHITKRYGDVEALRDLSLEIGSGELFGLIGPDGAGKTTLFRILTTLLLADSGTASVCGLPAAVTSPGSAYFTNTVPVWGLRIRLFIS